MSDKNGEPPSTPIGLCETCRFVRTQGTKRGAIFYRCGRADEDDRFQRYPPLPVSACSGFQLQPDPEPEPA